MLSKILYICVHIYACGSIYVCVYVSLSIHICIYIVFWNSCHACHTILNCYCLLFFFLFLFIYWLCWVFVAPCGLSLVVASGGYSLLRCAGFSLWWFLLWSMGSRHVGLVALRHVGSSWTRARTRGSCPHW